MNNSTNDFLDLYRQFEELLRAKYKGVKIKAASPVVEYMNTEGSEFYTEIDFCKDLRNILSHHPNLDGEEALYPSDKLMDTLRHIVDILENPVTAKDLATPCEKLLSARYSDKVEAVLRSMHENGFSHVPVIGGKMVIGVFSLNVMYKYMKENRTVDFTNLTVHDVKKYLPVGVHIGETYGFVRSGDDIPTLSTMFRHGGPNRARVAALFVTENGKSDGDLIGMLTPWDVIKNANDTDGRV